MAGKRRSTGTLILVCTVIILFSFGPVQGATVIRTGTLSVDTVPSGASLYIDGALKGATPYSGSLAAGDHALIFRLSGYEDLDVTITVPSGGKATGSYTMVSAATTTIASRIVTRQVSTGTLIIESSPTGASVYIDGTLKGTTPVTVKAIKTGDHLVVLKADGYADLSSTVTVPAGGESSNQFEMSCNVLSVDSVPSGASLYIDGELKGTTPFTIRAISAGDHEITLKKTGYKEYSTTQNVPPGVQVNLHATMVAVPTSTIRTTAPETSVVPAHTTQMPETCPVQATGSGELTAGPDGRINCTIILRTEDRLSVLTIDEGTVVVDLKTGNVRTIQTGPLRSLEGLPDAGSGSVWTGRAYTYRPGITSLSPAARVSFTLTTDDLERYDPQNLTLRETTADGMGWEDLPTAFDPATKTLSSSVRHFGTIGVFANMAIPATTETTMGPTLSVTETADNPAPSPSHLIPEKMLPVAAVATGIAVSVIGTMAGVQGFFSSIWDRIVDLIRDLFGDQISGRISESEIERRAIRPAENLSSVFFTLSPREILALCLAALGFGMAFMIQDRLEVDLLTIAIFVGAGGVATLLPDLANKFFAYRSGCVTEYRVWPLGFLTMLATAWLFQNTFAKPSRALIMGEKAPSVAESGVIKLAGPLTNIIVAIAFVCIIPLGGLFAVAGTAGFSINLLNGVFSLLPIKPNDGVEIFAWNKLVWAALFFPVTAYYLYVCVLL